MDRNYVYFLFGVLCLIATTASAVDEFLQILKNRGAAIYCGRNLSDVLSLVCRGKYNTPPTQQPHDLQKRDTHHIRHKRAVSNILFALLPKTSREEFAVRVKRKRRRPRGVYNECCQKPCSYDVLKSYCADDR